MSDDQNKKLNKANRPLQDGGPRWAIVLLGCNKVLRAKVCLIDFLGKVSPVLSFCDIKT